MKIKKKNWSLIFISYFCLLSTLLILYCVFKFSAYGIDFTDEGYYLNWIYNPFLYTDFNLSKYGFIYYPLYNLVDGNIAWLRRVNFFITFVLACILVYLVINKLIIFEKINKVIQCILSSGIAISSFTYVTIQTPSYNHLTFQALLITGIGIALIDVTKFNKNVLSYIIIGIGGWLTLMAKPSSAVGLAIIVIMYIILSKQFQLRFLLIAAITSFILFIVSAYIIDGSITAYFERYFLFFKINTLLGEHRINSIFRIDALNLSNKIVLSIFFIFSISVYFIWPALKNYKVNNFIYIISCFLILVVIATLTVADINWNPNFGLYQPYQLFGIGYVCLFTIIILIINNEIKIHDIHLGLFLLFLILPYIQALGTNSNYWLQSGYVSLFWLISGFVLIIPWFCKLKLYQPLIFLVLVSQLITSIHIKERIEKPFRYNQSLRLDDSRIVINNNHQLILSKEFANYINDARKIAAQSGFTKEDAIIDLSGQSPGLLYLLGAKSIGTAWNVGGYKGSLDMAKATFNLVDCTDIANAWVLYESKGPRSISTDLLTSLGMNFPKQYQKVGSWETASGAGGYKEIRIQELYKPLNVNIAKASCELKRKTTLRLNE
jgi:hypothetical protein